MKAPSSHLGAWLLHNSASNIDFSAAELANEIFYHCLPCLVEKKHAKAQKSVPRSQ